MEDFEFVNQDFFNMWKERTNKQKSSTKSEESGTPEDKMNFNGSSINITAKIDLEKIVYPD